MPDRLFSLNEWVCTLRGSLMAVITGIYQNVAIIISKRINYDYYL